MPWTCKGCDEVIEDAFDECWNCGTNRDGRPSQNEEFFVNADVSFSDAGAPAHLALEPSDRDIGSDEPIEHSAAKDGRGRTLTTPRPVTSSAAHRLAARAATRYSDAYLVASAITSWASMIKILGLVAAVAVFGAATVVAKALGAGTGTMAAFIGFIPGAMVAVAAYGIGVIVSAQGQILQATLDSAVHSSPFLRNEQRVQIMAL